MTIENGYLELMRDTMANGVDRGDRTGTGTRSKFGHMLRHDLATGFPLLTTKRVWWHGIVHELLWFLNGETNIGPLKAQKVGIWDEWATEDGEVGKMYGAQWTNWEDTRLVSAAQWAQEAERYQAEGYTLVAEDTVRGNVTIQRKINQVARVVEQLRNLPESRRIVISAWNTAELPSDELSPQGNVEAGNMALAPCHAFVQFYVAEGKLSCLVVQRSVDQMLGLPFNLASYALLTHMLAQQADLAVGDLVWVGGDCHVYSNHMEQVQTQLSRVAGELPTLTIARRAESIFDYTADDFVIEGYSPQAHIAAPIAV